MNCEDLIYRSRVGGCILGGAIGDALGAPVEFLGAKDILDRVGPKGVTEYLPTTVGNKRYYGLITDDTQMTLFTLEGLIRACGKSIESGSADLDLSLVHRAYDRWLDTQNGKRADRTKDGWLVTQAWLRSPRAPGETCLNALQETAFSEQFGRAASNDSKGCGGIMRSAPFGLVPKKYFPTLKDRFEAAARGASYTHGHVTGQLASGALAALIGALIEGETLQEAIDTTLTLLCQYPGHEETSRAIEQAVLAAQQPAGLEVLESLGGGWIAEETLAISLYAALCFPNKNQVLQALSLAVTHSGDADSTGAVCGNILGALHGQEALPPQLLFEVEGRGPILQLIDDFILQFTRGSDFYSDPGRFTRWMERYPSR